MSIPGNLICPTHNATCQHRHLAPGHLFKRNRLPYAVGRCSYKGGWMLRFKLLDRGEELYYCAPYPLH
jgi:hypothetical protein